MKYSLSKIFENSHQNKTKVFYLVSYLFDEQDEFAKQLSDRKIEDIIGISDNKFIIPSFLGIGRNLLLVMPGDEVIKNNNISKIEYNNIDFLLKNNMEMLYRIFSKNSNSYSGRYGLMNNITDYIESVTKPWNVREPFGFLMKNLYEGYWQPAREYGKSNISINNVDDLINFLHNSATIFSEKTKNISFAEFVKPVLNAFNKIAKIYKSEGEWVINDKVLNVPKNSTLIFSVSKSPNEFSKEQLEIINSDEKIFHMDWDDAYDMKYFRTIITVIKKYNLDKLYKIIWLDNKQFEKMKLKLNKNK